MLVTYDAQADALSVDLLPGARRARTVQVRAGILAHFDERDRLIEIEILGAGAHYDPATLQRLVSPAEYLTLAEASRESGLEASTLRRQIHKGKVRAVKRGHDWLVTRAALWTYLENRAPSGRPSRRKGARRRAGMRRT